MRGAIGLAVCGRRIVSIAAVCLTVATSRAGSISGRVTGPNGTTPLADVTVTAWRKGAFLWSGTDTHTAGDGTYSFGSLVAATYRIEFNRDGDVDYAHETYPDRPLLTQGDDLVVTTSSAHTGIDASLAVASHIAGQVFGPGGIIGLAGISVWAYRYDGTLGWRRLGEFAHSDASGGYTIRGLAAGAYRVRFQDLDNGDYAAQVYTNASELDDGQDVVLLAGQTVAGINATLTAAGKISGRVVFSNGAPVTDGAVEPLVRQGTSWDYADANAGFMDDDGYYTVSGLAPGTYRVKIIDWNEDGVLDEIYDNAIEPEYGRDIVVAAGETVRDINAVLDIPSWPPRIVRVTPQAYGYQIAYTARDNEHCDLQATDALSNGWSTVVSGFISLRGVNTHQEFIYPLPRQRFWRIRSAATRAPSP